MRPTTGFVRCRLPFASAVLLMAAVGAMLRCDAVNAQATRRTVWDGVYTEAQAARGLAAYKEHCGYCHRDDLSGGGSEAGAPALVGPLFIYRWRDQPVADLFVTIGTTMPQNKPDTLQPGIVADIVSFILKSNALPAGAGELPLDVEALTAIAMTPRRP